nr:integrase, catalytic region, zinc finger, CCHC-type, peptidase aspartic, catalytic [Tanacetum cinerariifolium]
MRQFCDSDLEVAFRQHTCFIRNLDRIDLLTGSRGNNLYTLSLQDMMASSPIFLLSKASKTKSWLYLARQGLVRDRIDLLTGSRGNNLYTLSLQDMMASSPIFLLSKASKTKSWLYLARQGLVRGLLGSRSI